MHTRTFSLQLPAYYFFQPRGHCSNQTQNFPVKIIHDQTFFPLFVVLKNVCMIKSQFPHHTLSYVRSEWNKLPQDTTEDMQFFQPPPPPPPPPRLLQPPYLLSDFFNPPFPRLLPSPFSSGLESTCNVYR